MNGNFTRASIVCSEPPPHQFLDSNQSQRLFRFIQEAFTRQLSQETRRAHGRNAARLGELPSTSIFAARNRQQGSREIFSQ